MHIHRLKIFGLRGINTADIILGQHTVLVGANNSGKTTIIEALSLLLGRERMVRRLTEHDFFGSQPDANSRIKIIVTLTGFPQNNPQHSPEWFRMDRGIDKWLDPNNHELQALRDATHNQLAVQIGFAARFDLELLEVETMRFFVDDEASLDDPFIHENSLHPISTRTLQDLGFFLVPASRTWDKWISFSSELFRRVVATQGGVPAQAVRAERARLWNPTAELQLEKQPGLEQLVQSINDELRQLLPFDTFLQLRITATDSDSILEAIIPHFVQNDGPTLPSARQGTGLISMQSLLLLMQFGRARSEAGKSFVLAVEEPEVHIQPAQQRRLVNRINALCNQTIITTHSPIVASMFPAASTLFVSKLNGTMHARPLMKTVVAEPTNHQQHLLYAWRQKLIAALMHDCVLIPEGVSDVAWLDAICTALELHQTWDTDEESQSRFSTFVGVVPTDEAKIAQTLELVNGIHTRASVILDGDTAGMGYFNVVRSMTPPPTVVIFWPNGWTIENIICWIADAAVGNVLPRLGAALNVTFADLNALRGHLLTQKSYTPTQETSAVVLMSNQDCRARTAQLLNGLADILLAPASNVQRINFSRDQTLSTQTMNVYRFVP